MTTAFTSCKVIVNDGCLKSEECDAESVEEDRFVALSSREGETTNVSLKKFEGFYVGSYRTENGATAAVFVIVEKPAYLLIVSVAVSSTFVGIIIGMCIIACCKCCYKKKSAYQCEICG